MLSLNKEPLQNYVYKRLAICTWQKWHMCVLECNTCVHYTCTRIWADFAKKVEVERQNVCISFVSVTQGTILHWMYVEYRYRDRSFETRKNIVVNNSQQISRHTHVYFLMTSPAWFRDIPLCTLSLSTKSPVFLRQV